MNCKHFLEVLNEHVPARPRPGCRRSARLVVVIDCELHGRVTPRPAKDESIRCCDDRCKDKEAAE